MRPLSCAPRNIPDKIFSYIVAFPNDHLTLKDQCITFDRFLLLYIDIRHNHNFAFAFAKSKRAGFIPVEGIISRIRQSAFENNIC